MPTLTENIPTRADLPQMPQVPAPHLPKKVRRARRASGIAVSAGRGIFHVGERWGGTKSEVRHAARALRDDPGSTAGRAAPTLAAGFVGGIALGYLLDPANGRERRTRLRERIGAMIAKLRGRTVPPASVEPPTEPRSTQTDSSEAGPSGTVTRDGASADPVVRNLVAGVDA